MKIHYHPQNLYETAIAQRDRRYAAWLGEMSYASERLTGVNAIKDMRAARLMRRWYLQELDPIDAVTHYQRWLISTF